VPPPTLEHQEILLSLMILFTNFITPRNLGRAVIAPYRVKIAEGRFCEPDIVFVLESNASRLKNQFGETPDLLMEVVSEDDPKRDLVDKRADYAAAGIPEYWIVDPRTKTIAVLRLENDQYVVHSEAVASGQVRSALLDSFAAEVAAIFAAGLRE
jgi:Uma2 family endonuclease